MSDDRVRQWNSTLSVSKSRLRNWRDKGRGSLDRSTGLGRSTPMKPVNSARKKKLYERNYGEKADWIREQACYATARLDGIVAAHTRHTKASGQSEGSKDLVPFFAEVEIDWHGLDEAKFAAKYGVTKQQCKDAAVTYEERWQAVQCGETDLPW